jgi:rhodanese-related sulfurtransferase
MVFSFEDSGDIVVESITTAELAELLKGDSGKILLLDVREDEERAVGLIEPSVHMPMNSVPDHLAELPHDRRIIVYCHHGGRSYAVAGYLETEGFKDVTNLTGGIDEWSRLIDADVPRY